MALLRVYPPSMTSRQTYPLGIKDAYSGLHCEANKKSAWLVTLLFLLRLVPWDDCQVVQDALGPCGSSVLVSAHEKKSRVRGHTTVGLLASASARVRVCIALPS